MPRIPQVFAGGQIGGGIAPPRASTEMADLSGYQQALGQLGKAAQTFQQTSGVLKDEGAKIEAELALGEMERQAADADILLRQDDTVTPDTYSKRTDENLRAIRQGVGKSIQSAEGRMLFERASEKFLTKKSIEGKYEGVKLADAQVKAGTDTLLRSDANQAVFGATPEIQEQGMQRGLARIQGLLNRRQLTGSEANDKVAGFLADVDEGQARRAAQSPAQRTQVIDDLVNGRFRYMKADAQLALADRLMREADVAQRKVDADLEKEIQADKEQAMTEWTQAALKGTESPQVLLRQLDALTARHRIKDTEYQRLHKLLTEPSTKHQIESDEATLRAVIADTHSMRPRMSEADLNGLYDRGLLNVKDWKGALDRRRETLESNRREGHSLLMQQHAQAEQEALKHAGVVTPFSSLDKTQEKLIPEVLTELRRRSSAYPGGQEPPLKVLEELIPQIRRTLSRDASFTIQELEKLIKYPTKAALEEARKRKEITEGFYLSERDRILRLEEARKRKQENEEKTQQKTGPGGKAPAGGSTNPFGRPR
jgi:hypothetical protein